MLIRPIVRLRAFTSLYQLLATTRGRLLLLVVVVLLPMLGLVGFLSLSWYQARRVSEYQANLEMARSTANAFAYFVKEVLHDEQTAGTAIAIKRNYTPSDLNRLLSSLCTERPAILRVNWVNRQGVITASSDRQAIGTRLSDRDWFLQLMRGHAWTVSSLIISRVDKRPIFVIAHPVRGADGQLLGILDSVIDAAALDAVLAIPRHYGGGIAVFDPTGTCAFFSPPQDLSWTQRGWLREDALIQAGLRREEHTGIIAAYGEGRPAMAGVAPVPTFGWVAVAYKDRQAAMAPLTRSMLTNFALFVLTVLLAVLIARQVSDTITHPLQRLYAMAVAMEHGEYLPPREVRGPSEIHDLTAAFARMALSLKGREDELRTVSLTDDMTGLYNHRGFIILGEQETRVAANLKQQVCLLYLDLNKLKTINDLYGHPAGDQALMAVADTLRASFRTTDLIGRLGGDEFAVLGWNLTPETAEHLRQRLHARLSACDIGVPVTLSVSVGMVFSDPDSQQTLGDLLAQADASMYREKQRLYGLDYVASASG